MKAVNREFLGANSAQPVPTGCSTPLV